MPKNKIETLHLSDLERKTGQKMNQIKHNTQFTLHHILCKSRKGDGVDTRSDDGHIRLEKGLHQKLHNFFGNLLPHEQLIVWYYINRQVLSKHFRTMLKRLPVKNIYNDKFKKNNFKW